MCYVKESEMLGRDFILYSLTSFERCRKLSIYWKNISFRIFLWFFFPMQYCIEERYLPSFFRNYIHISPLILALCSEKLSVYLVFLLEFSAGKISCWSIVSPGAGISDTDRWEEKSRFSASVANCCNDLTSFFPLFKISWVSHLTASRFFSFFEGLLQFPPSPPFCFTGAWPAVLKKITSGYS